jgi:glutaconate CoA-transferase subunit B
LRLIGNGPDWVVTELGVFDFDPESKIMRLRYLYPDTTVQMILDNTEFKPVIHPDVRVMDMPTKADIELIRKIDPLRAHANEFPPKELTREFVI